MRRDASIEEDEQTTIASLSSLPSNVGSDDNHVESWPSWKCKVRSRMDVCVCVCMRVCVSIYVYVCMCVCACVRV